MRLNDGVLAGRLVVVVGAGSSGSGLSNGEAAAIAYAEAGASVVAVDRDLAEAHRVARGVAEAGVPGHPIAADVTVERDVAEAAAQILEHVGTPHVVHYNVGLATLGEVTELEYASWTASVDANLGGAYLTAHHFLPAMLAAGRGVITNVSSIASIRTTGYTYPAYSAAKAGLNQLTASIALTYADRGIRANTILPGLIDSPMVRRQLTGDPSELAARHVLSPTGRMGSPRDVANAAVFLASDAAGYINGVCLPVDGGLSNRCV